MKIIKKLQVSIDFSTKILINSLASGVPPTERFTNAYFKKILIFCPNFREKFYKILKNCLKNRKISFKIFKKLNIFIAFLTFSEKFSGILGPPGPSRGEPLYKPSLDGPRSPPPKKIIPAGAIEYVCTPEYNEYNRYAWVLRNYILLF